MHLKNGVALGTYGVLDLSSTEESLPFPVAGVNAQNLDVTIITDVIASLMPNVNVLDYPDAKPGLLKLQTQHRQAIALPGEPLGVTSKVTNHIPLQPGAQPSYVSSRRLPHSQRQVVQQKIDELLEEGVIQTFITHGTRRSFWSQRKTDPTALSLTSARSMLVQSLTITHSQS